MSAPPLWTPRLWLTPLTPLHLDGWMALVREALGSDAIDRGSLERERAASELHFSQGKVGLYVTWLRAGGEMAGFVGFAAADTLVFMLAHKQRRHGYGREMCSALLQQAHNVGREEIATTIANDDTAARKLVEALGFTLHEAADGRLRFTLPR